MQPLSPTYSHQMFVLLFFSYEGCEDGGDTEAAEKEEPSPEKEPPEPAKVEKQE